MKHKPSERKIKQYVRDGLPNGKLIDASGYRKAFYRADKQLTRQINELRNRKNSI